MLNEWMEEGRGTEEQNNGEKQKKEEKRWGEGQKGEKSEGQ